MLQRRTHDYYSISSGGGGVQPHTHTLIADLYRQVRDMNRYLAVLQQSYQVLETVAIEEDGL